MKKKLSLLVAVVMALGITFAFSGCGGGDSSGESSGDGAQTFTIAHLQTENSAAGQYFTKLGEMLEENSGGKIKTEIYAGGTMAGSDTELAELVRAGTVSMVPVPTHALSALVDIPEYRIFEMPYLFTDWDEIYKVLDSDLAKDWAKPLADNAGVKVYGGLVKGWLSVGLKGQEPIASPTDLKGKKVRTMATDMQQGLIKALGGSASTVAYGELYTAIQQGTVDGSLTATNLYVADRFGEVVDSLSVIRATAHFHLPTVSTTWYDALPDDLKTVFDDTMNEWLDYAREQEQIADEDAMKELSEKMNVKVKEYTDEELAPFKAATKDLFAKNKAACGDGVVDGVLQVLNKTEADIFGK